MRWLHEAIAFSAPYPAPSQYIYLFFLIFEEAIWKQSQAQHAFHTGTDTRGAIFSKPILPWSMWKWGFVAHIWDDACSTGSSWKGHPSSVLLFYYILKGMSMLKEPLHFSILKEFGLKKPLFHSNSGQQQREQAQNTGDYLQVPLVQPRARAWAFGISSGFMCYN